MDFSLGGSLGLGQSGFGCFFMGLFVLIPDSLEVVNVFFNIEVVSDLFSFHNEL